MPELVTVIHVHSVHSDGTGTIPEIAHAARRASADAVLVTDHDTMAGRSQEGRIADVLVGVGVEISPARGDHLLAFGVPSPVPHVSRTRAQVIDAVHAAGGVCFAAHPFSLGGWLLGRAGRAAPWGDLRAPVDGWEVWSLVTDTLERIRSPRELVRFRRDPDAVLDGPPARNLAAWDALGRTRRVPAIGGLDAHQYGLRVRGRVPVRTMSYERSFGLLRTHALVDEPAGLAQLYAALAAGRSFLARDSLADARGFAFGSADGAVGMGDEAPLAGGMDLIARSPREAELTLLHDGEPVARATATELRHRADAPGVWRVEARLDGRVWVLANPVYVR